MRVIFFGYTFFVSYIFNVLIARHTIQLYDVEAFRNLKQYIKRQETSSYVSTWASGKKTSAVVSPSSLLSWSLFFRIDLAHVLTLHTHTYNHTRACPSGRFPLKTKMLIPPYTNRKEGAIHQS